MNQNNCLFAPAKINLNLHVLGKRDDGYHLLESIITFADIGDEICVEESDALKLEISGEFASSLSDKENLALLAAKKISDAFKLEKGALIKLKKNLPIGSGMGGGSTDAAATIKLLCKLWDLDVNDPKIDEIALSLGADVPICMLCSPAFVSGIGEEIVPINVREGLPTVLINPMVELDTAKVFSLKLPKYSPKMADIETEVSSVDFLKQLRNDLEGNAISIVPEIKTILDSLNQCDGIRLSRMTGSGATCFGIFKTEQDAKKAALRISQEQPNFWVKPTKLKSISGDYL